MRSIHVVVLALLVACGGARPPPELPEIAQRGSMVKLERPRGGIHAFGRTGDLAVRTRHGSELVIAANEDAPGHRPRKGAIVDVGALRVPEIDPIDWWRFGFVDARKQFHLQKTLLVEARDRCVHVEGDADGVILATDICPKMFTFEIRTTGVLPPGAEYADEIQAMTSQNLIEDDGGGWEGDHPSSFLMIVERDVLLDVEGISRATRKVMKLEDDTWPPPIVCVHHGLREAMLSDGRRLQAGRNWPSEHVEMERGSYALVNDAGRELFRSPVAGRTIVSAPPGLHAKVILRDADGIPLGPPREIGGDRSPERSAPRGAIRLVTDAATQYLFKGVNGTPDPVLDAGYSIYSKEKSRDVVLPFGTYAVTATRGPLASIERFEVTVNKNEPIEHVTKLASFVPPGFVSADLHLHQAPSRDSGVPIASRVLALACQSIDVAVATDHDAITDFGPAIASLGLARPLSIVGEEITTAGRRHWGHFNAFPLPLPKGAQEDSIARYFDVTPAEIFSLARAMGARVVQVNHPRYATIGFFDLVHLDPKTGTTDPTFSDDFDAVEIMNGFELQSIERMRQLNLDLVGLARKGKRVTVTGNSDSHQLFYEEAGYPRTWVHANRPEEALSVISAGDTVASSGPLLDVTFSGRRPGSMFQAKTIDVHVRAHAASWIPMESIDIVRDGEIVKTFSVTETNDGLRFDGTFTVPIAHDSIVWVFAHAEKPIPFVLPNESTRAAAITTPVYVDAEGDGRVVVP